MKCKFDLAWIGPCGKDCDGDYCSEHLGVKCVVTGKQATHECPHAGQFVCGYPLSDEARHGYGQEAFHVHV